MTELDFEIELEAALLGDAMNLQTQISRIRTFQDTGMMTRNKGLIVTMQNGDRFQITIVKE